jgi:hypothetical protein
MLNNWGQTGSIELCDDNVRTVLYFAKVLAGDLDYLVLGGIKGSGERGEGED